LTAVRPPPADEVLDCLRHNRDRLTNECRREQLLLEQQEAENIMLRPGLLKACANERSVFCDKVKGGNGRVFR
jgi:Golgi apparatus protein 1